MVQNLNAQYTGGFTGSQLEATGGENSTPVDTFIPVGSNPTVVANTGPLPNGAYFVTATALLFVAPGDSEGFCDIILASQPTNFLSEGGASQEGTIQAAETTTVVVQAGDSLEEVCRASGNNGSETVSTGITAIRVLAAFHPSSARAAGLGTTTARSPARPPATGRP